MELSDFIVNLLREGKVLVNGPLISFSEEDISEAKKILHEYYREDIIEMPYIPPAFSENAALWAATYLFKAIQLTVLRDGGEEMINENLRPFVDEQDASAIYSADLILRYLPQLFELAKGLAPADKLVQALKKAAGQWPYSSVGIELNEAVEDKLIFEHPSLKYTYIDRIIQMKDQQRSRNETVTKYIHEVAGEHILLLWPRFKTL